MVKMKIVIIINNAIGLLRFRSDLIKELSSQGHEVVALTPYGKHEEELQILNIRCENTEIDRRKINLIKEGRLLKKYYSCLNKENPDLVITYTIKPNIYGGIICQILGIPYAANVTGLGTAFENRGFVQLLAVVMNKVGLKKAKWVFFENANNLNQFVSKRIIQARQAVLLNGAGVNLDHFRLIDYPKDSTSFQFLFIGRIMREKGINELFEAMKRLVEEGYKCSLDVLGGLEEEYQDKITQYTEEGWLNYHGFQKDVRPYIKRTHCFVLPSWHEGMANTNLECAASGRPIITSNIPGCREAVINGKTGLLCEVKNTDSLFDEMKKMLELSNDRRKEMGIAGRRYMENMFDKRKVVEKTISTLMK